MVEIPERAAAIDPAWLTSALADRHPEVRIAAVEVSDQAEGTNSHAWLDVTYEASSAPGPARLFCKLLPAEGARRQAIAMTRMGLREAKFYERLAGRLPLRVPEAHVVRYEDDDFGAFVLLLEDLGASGCSISTGPESPSPDAAAAALEDLAAMHVRFENAGTREREADWVPRPDPPSDYGTTRLQEGLDHHRHRLTDAFAEMAELYIDQQAALHALWQEGPETVLHGDAHIGNLFLDAGRVGFLDWGLIVVSTPMRDVSYFLNMGLSVEDRRRCDADLIRHYLDVRATLGGDPISFDDAWRAHRCQAGYLAPASCQVVTFPEDVSPERARFADAFLERASAAIEDLESRAALRDFAGL